MGRIIGGVEIDRDSTRAPAPPPVMPFDDTGRQLAPHRIEFLAAHLVFEARHRRLRGERLARHRVPIEQELVNRVVGEPVGIVPMGWPHAIAEDALAQQVFQRVPDLAGLPVVDQTLGEPLDQPILSLRRFQQDGPAIGARMLLIERRDEGLGEEVREQDSLWYRLGIQAKASLVVKSRCGNSFLLRGGLCVSSEMGSFVNYPG